MSDDDAAVHLSPARQLVATRNRSRSLLGLGFERFAVALVSGEAFRSVEDSEGAVGIPVHPDLDLDVVGPCGVLQGPVYQHSVLSRPTIRFACSHRISSIW